ncbi:hypothetical protein CMUS01_15956 [Colletotrichum musicola]|uniref:Uncharacterized protein n=1 Tax=Colletotrichum musicola TaxID=2175873 RepID=A0A8H6ISX6_9PEZI|nr:hypothetical protein CMUS01_15956 [Colletotrichum musicola]
MMPAAAACLPSSVTFSESSVWTRQCRLNDRGVLDVGPASAPGSEIVVIEDSDSGNEADKANGDATNA